MEQAFYLKFSHYVDDHLNRCETLLYQFGEITIVFLG